MLLLKCCKVYTKLLQVIKFYVIFATLHNLGIPKIKQNRQLPIYDPITIKVYVAYFPTPDGHGIFKQLFYDSNLFLTFLL